MWQRQCKEKYLSRAYRRKDRRFWNMLQGIRTTMPKKALLHDLCRGRKAWGRRPTLIEVRRVLKRHPKTTMMTCTRRAATELNHLAIAAKFPKRAPLVTVPGDPESNPENYVGSKLRQSKTLRPLNVPIYRGMRVYITDNVHKENDYCNGMLAYVEHYCKKRWGHPGPHTNRQKTDDIPMDEPSPAWLEIILPYSPGVRIHDNEVPGRRPRTRNRMARCPRYQKCCVHCLI